MKGFKDFLMRGNLVEIAVGLIIAASFGAVVTTFTAVLMSLIGKIFGTPNFDTYRPGGVPVGEFITAVVSFVILAFIVYFFVVKPYQAMRERFTQEEEATTEESVVLLREIRDSLQRG
ncbi:large conductance mechanosensitive channel protein MscL [Kribbia dieselivorans]|uniref:large conductance mechanosensitive channel protein MscL n=1 Tax=Kribbia dieselivorans TaxID=331526 RepID=UPI000838FE2D|nr:large conductance mechanosensitive channel protein MscL [Kribbia dieselivorans]